MKLECRLLILNSWFNVRRLCGCSYKRSVPHSSARDPSRLSVLSICHATANVTVGVQLYNEWPVTRSKGTSQKCRFVMSKICLSSDLLISGFLCYVKDCA